tara:strand:- start:262 stop:435 length:174 start_codon:yes stop_codon:yes gene_type:complete
MAELPKTPAEIIDYAKRNNIQIVDLKFTDLPGTMQHFSVPTNQLDENSFNVVWCLKY